MTLSFPFDTDITICHYDNEPDEQLALKAGVPVETVEIWPSMRANESDFYFGGLAFSYGVPNHLFTVIE